MQWPNAAYFSLRPMRRRAIAMQPAGALSGAEALSASDRSDCGGFRSLRSVDIYAFWP